MLVRLADTWSEAWTGGVGAKPRDGRRSRIEKNRRRSRIEKDGRRSRIEKNGRRSRIFFYGRIRIQQQQPGQNPGLLAFANHL